MSHPASKSPAGNSRASRWLRPLLSLLLACCAATAAAQQQAPSDQAAKRLESAAPAIKSLLQRLEDRRQKENWTFTVGYTAALDVADRHLTGALPSLPPARVLKAQKAHADRAVRYYDKLRRDRGLRRDRSDCDPARTAFSWRDAGKVTPPRGPQGACGSCWAFAALAAFESSYLIENSIEINGSEQDLLNCTPDSSCRGGYLGNALRRLTTWGVATDLALPYVHRRHRCSKALRRPYLAVTWSPIDSRPRRIIPADEMKRALCEHGPIATRMIVSPSFRAYTSGVYQQVEPVVYNSPKAHFVVIIGWDEEKRAWLIKNSWDPATWGEGGFAWIRYRANLIGHSASWIQAAHLDLTLDPGLAAMRRGERPIPPGPLR